MSTSRASQADTYLGRQDDANPTGAYVMAAGAVVFLMASFVSWITNQDDESFGGYEADSLIAFTAYLGIGLAIALIMAAQRSERRIQHRGLSLASMAAGVAALGSLLRNHRAPPEVDLCVVEGSLGG